MTHSQGMFCKVLFITFRVDLLIAIIPVFELFIFFKELSFKGLLSLCTKGS